MGRGVYIAPFHNPREISGQPFPAMNKRFSRLEQAYALANTFSRAIVQTHARFFHRNEGAALYRRQCDTHCLQRFLDTAHCQHFDSSSPPQQFFPGAITADMPDLSLTIRIFVGELCENWCI